jgi:hypothetical protein
MRERTIVANKQPVFEGCPFVGLVAYRIDQGHLFFGRQKETLRFTRSSGSRSGSHGEATC